VVKSVDSDRIVIEYKRTEDERTVSFDGDEKEYKLTKFLKTNQSTCMNLRPDRSQGREGDGWTDLCEGYGTQNGELAIGKNLQVAFMPWKGYNFEDAIVISERVASEDIFTSIHIDEYIMEVRDTKRGLEELTAGYPERFRRSHQGPR
jgi:DNA-directed RNA polymerase subunit beta